MYSVFCLFALLCGGGSAAPETEYRVSSREEFLDAVGSDRTITLDSGKIVLVEIPPPCDYECAPFPCAHVNPHVSYNTESDGVTVVVSDIENLTILGSGNLNSSLLTEPRYSFVIEFVNCSNIRIENLIAGHTDGGYCENGVFGFLDCVDVVISNCDLFGCGTVGIELKNTSRFRFENSVIRDCTYGIMELIESEDIFFENSVFRDNGEFFGIAMRYCSDVQFSNCLFENKVLNLCPPLLPTGYADEITFVDCIVSDYSCEQLEGITCVPK